MAVIDAPSVTITVPAGYLEDLRGAIVAEIGWDSEALAAEHKELREQLASNDEYRELQRQNRDGQARQLNRDMRIFDQLLAATGNTKVTADRDTLFHALEAMVKVLADRLVDVCSFTPLDTSAVLELVGRLRWAAEQARPLARD